MKVYLDYIPIKPVNDIYFSAIFGQYPIRRLFSKKGNTVKKPAFNNKMRIGLDNLNAIDNVRVKEDISSVILLLDEIEEQIVLLGEERINKSEGFTNLINEEISKLIKFLRSLNDKVIGVELLIRIAKVAKNYANPTNKSELVDIILEKRGKKNANKQLEELMHSLCKEDSLAFNKQIEKVYKVNASTKSDKQHNKKTQKLLPKGKKYGDEGWIGKTDI